MSHDPACPDVDLGTHARPEDKCQPCEHIRLGRTDQVRRIEQALDQYLADLSSTRFKDIVINTKVIARDTLRRLT